LETAKNKYYITINDNDNFRYKIINSYGIYYAIQRNCFLYQAIFLQLKKHIESFENIGSGMKQKRQFLQLVIYERNCHLHSVSFLRRHRNILITFYLTPTKVSQGLSL
jgi:hypothetical protein